MIKAVKVLNVASTFMFVVILLLIYAYLPISVDLNIDGVENIHKHRFFYYSITAFIGINILLRIILNLGFKGTSENVLAWMTGLIFILNVYLTFLVGFVGVWNNATHISPSNYAYLNFLGPVFVFFWFGGLIFLVVKKK
ncbi:MAG: hypothetical protein RIM99_09350 [Cyclobacteriaceae bacterium]